MNKLGSLYPEACQVGKNFKLVARHRLDIN